jgi:hypothetical protein
MIINHNQYCQDDWEMYLGDGPRGMGPNGDGCVCELAPPEHNTDPQVKWLRELKGS